MILPSQVTPPDSRPPGYAQDVTALELLADGAIRHADHEQAWPAKVRRVRSPICREAIVDTAARYREAGWVVQELLRSDSYFTIDRPVTP